MVTKADDPHWWAKKRLPYNICLAVAGVTAFMAYATVGWTVCSDNPDIEITAFTAAFQAIGYLFAMIAANIFYGLGPLAERLYQPQNLQLYRRSIFGLGLIFSISLPFLVPLALFAGCMIER
tara:strand:- start:677 stop:1042 length:366 start_codon:yes stop_codon:yes gene_type:complete